MNTSPIADELAPPAPDVTQTSHPVMTTPSTTQRQARLIMEAVAILHERGFGRLKLLCYVKEGLGAWRHVLFAADEYPTGGSQLPVPNASGSLPGYGLATGASAAEVADRLQAKHLGLLTASVGLDSRYVAWYRAMLNDPAGGVLEMEDASRACLDGDEIRPLSAWPR